MPSHLPPTSPAAPRPQPFTLYGANGRIYASNVDQKLIDLGSLTHTDAGFCYCIDGNGLRGEALPTAEAALRDFAERTSFLFLDGQFTAVADLRGSEVSLAGAVRVDITLDELAPGEPMENANV